MNRIKKLSQELCNQIAAGEVIQNPASLIKELVENALDAHATNIEIELIQSGIEKIVVKDNGIGILKEDLHLAPKRHATSKISSFDDLYNISTMGFRGEALASIFSVAKVTLQSKPKTQEYAYQISTPQLDIRKVAHNNGTTIIIEELFYNVPARKKYLKNPQYELKEIIKIIKQISLIQPYLQISLYNNSKNIFKKTPHKNLIENSKEVLDINSSIELFPIEISSSFFIISGFMVNPNDINYSTRVHEYVYVNSRPIESQLIHKAVFQGIGTNIHLGRFPMYVLNIIIDPELIDVNIHPSKQEIKFEQEAVVFEQISKGIQKMFQSYILTKKRKIPENQKIDTFKNSQLNSINSTINSFDNQNSNTQNKSYQKDSCQEKSYFSKDFQKEFSSQKGKLQEEYRQSSYPHENILNSKQEKIPSTTVKTPLISLKEITNLKEIPHSPLQEYFDQYRILGQLHKTFILVEVKQGLLIIDQHVVEEKFYFELFKQYYTNEEFRSTQNQQLLKPLLLQISKEEELIFSEIQDILEMLGFDIEILKEKELIVRALPFDLKGKCLEISIIKSLLEQFTLSSTFEFIKNSKDYIHSHIIEHLAILSCKSSIRAGDELTISQMHELIAKLKRLEEPFNCPHGRPIIIEYSFKDFEKMFKRK